MVWVERFELPISCSQSKCLATRLHPDWRKGWDLNPGGPTKGLTVFETATFSHSDTLPQLELLASLGQGSKAA